ncbi:MAG: 16S rRNA (guanine(527)-N(7))-methyltransferase RsmG [Spirochaetes bacterium]|nr:16S rRNA (guanine(527)-N(7))-methyltransferase RsmG [Spirochaetota bacterium]
MELFLKFEDIIDGLYKKNIDKFLDYLIIENKKYNLTSILNREEMYYKHILDSLAGYFLMIKIFGDTIYGKKIADLGAGAGFPSIPIILYDSKLHFYLIESNNKKCNFLEKVKDNLNLNYVVINKNFKEIKEQKFDIILFRALDSIPNVIKNSKNIYSNVTFIFSYKGKKSSIKEELYCLDKNKKLKDFIKKIEIHNIYGIKEEERNIVEILWEKL